MSIKDVNDKLNINFSDLSKGSIKKSKIKSLVLEDFYIDNDEDFLVCNSLLAIKFNKFEFDENGYYGINHSLFDCFDTKGPLYINIDFINKVYDERCYYNEESDIDYLGNFPFYHNKLAKFDTRYVTVNYKDFILKDITCITEVRVFSHVEKLEKCQSVSNYFLTNMLNGYYSYSYVNLNEIPFINIV